MGKYSSNNWGRLKYLANTSGKYNFSARKKLWKKYFMISKMVIHFEKMESGFWKTWLGNDKRKKYENRTDSWASRGDRGSSPPLPPWTPLTPAIRGLGPPPGTPRHILRVNAPPQNSFFSEKIRVIVGDILVNFKNLA